MRSSRIISAIAAAALGAVVSAAGLEQVHISYTGIKGQIAIDFVSDVATGAVFCSTNGEKWTAVPSTSIHFGNIGYMHQSMCEFPATAGAKAFYRVASPTTNSSVFSIFPVPANGDAEVFAVWGDFGLTNDVCLNDIIAEAAKGTFDSVLHVGDWAYDFDSDASIVGNLFMNAIQPYASIKPTMPAEGNHEACGACLGVPELPKSQGNFSEYKLRFHATSLYAGANSGSGNNRYYSFNQGFTHFIVFTAEAYIYARDSTFLANQLAFMAADLAAVDRSATPWVVALVHKDWTMETEAFNAFTPILDKGGVDVLFCGHVHYYNRYMPYDAVTGQVDTASVSADGSVYTSPKYMVTIVTGASGDIERDDAYTKQSPSFTGTENYGYGLFTALNSTHATWTFKTVQPDGNGPKDYSDALTIVQTNHRVANFE